MSSRELQQEGMEMHKCQRCGEQVLPDLDDDGEIMSNKLCYHCFEDALEEHEERKRERIARENEY